jgi:hypothetical protein
MSDLNNIVQVVISRETQSIARASFGIPAIISEFSTAKTTEVFSRTRYYASLTEMVNDGWSTYDLEYKAAQIFFSQNPKVSQVMIGRKDSGDANWTAAFTAILIEQQNWYTFEILASKSVKILWDADFITGNLIDITINGVAVTQVPFNTDQATTMSDLETQIEADIANSVVTVSAARELTITITDTVASSIVVAVTGGASQAGETITYDDTGVEAAIKEAAAWAETQVKLYFYADNDATTITSGTSDLAYFMDSQNYDRTVSIYHPNARTAQTPAWMEAAFPGEALPFDPGTQTWAYKTLAGVASYQLTSSQRTNALGKNANIYTETAGVDITEEGKVASGEWIDIIRGIDDLTASLQEEIFSNLIQVRKIPYTDEGATLIAGVVEGVLNNKSGNPGLLVKDSIVVTAPLVADVAPADKIARLLPDINFTATLQGAIHKVEINGVVSV